MSYFPHKSRSFDINASSQTSVNLRGRMYACGSRAPCTTDITTRAAPSHRHPNLVNALGGPRSGIVRAVVFTVTHHRVAHRFVAFFRNNHHSSINPDVEGRIWQGDVIVLRVSARGDRFVHLRPTDGRMVDWAVRRFVVQGIHEAGIG